MEEQRVFGNRYKVTEKIGMGGMATVYKASDTTLGRTVAIKVMLPQYASDPTFAERFRQEAQAAANLQNPYIVNIYDWGQDNGEYYIVMEYVRGTDLKTAIEQRGKIHPRKVAEIASQACSALSLAHGYDIIHRDIKSANIMVQADGNIKVMDFGIAVAGNANMTEGSCVLGTAHYVSPEQAQGKPLGPTSDLYSLGVVMYEASTGQLPFDGPDAVSVATKQVNEMPVPPREINPDIDPALEAIILKAMQKDPKDRYQTANDMKKDLDAYIAGAPAPAAATVVMPNNGIPTIDEKTTVMDPVDDDDKQDAGKDKKKSRRNRIIVIIILVVVIAAIAVGVSIAACSSNAQQIVVPSVTGETLEDATKTLEDAGLKVGTVTQQESDSVEEGSVISQDPGANDSTAAGSSVDLVVSSGKGNSGKAYVPNLLGLTESEAEAALAEVGLTGEKSSDYNGTYSSGQVCDQSPAALTEVDAGSTVKYTISQGAKAVSVPSVIGNSEESAVSTLEGLGLNVKTTSGYSDNVGVGEVCDQSVKAGTEVNEGSNITLTISQGSDKVTVPDVTGETKAAAKADLKNAGFKLDWQYEVGEEGVVIRTDPKAGSSTSRGATITVYLGTGGEDTSGNTRATDNTGTN